EVLKELFTAMPADSGMAFVVIQHLDPSHVSHMSELLAKFTDMRVVQAEDQMALAALSVYTIPPNKFLGLAEGTLRLTEPVKRDGVRMPIDFFFRSLAEDQREKAICVLLSGSGSDGTLGIREIRGAGGMIMAQDPETAQFDSMSRSAIAQGWSITFCLWRRCLGRSSSMCSSPTYAPETKPRPGKGLMVSTRSSLCSRRKHKATSARTRRQRSSGASNGA